MLDEFKKFIKKFKKGKDMIESDKLEDLKQKLSSYSTYQWVKGDLAGAVTQFLNCAIEQDGTLMVEFMDGSRIGYNVLDKFMIKTNNPADLLDVAGGNGDVPEAADDYTADSLEDSDIPKTPNAKVKTNVRTKHQAAVQTKVQKVPDNPIHSLLEKQKENLVGIDMSIELNMPSPDLYRVICSSFDAADDEIINYIVGGLDIDKIKESLKESIKNYYSE